MLNNIELTICHTVNVVYSNTSVLFSNKSESIFPTHKSLDASHKQYMRKKKKKQFTKDMILCVSTLPIGKIILLETKRVIILAETVTRGFMMVAS